MKKELREAFRIYDKEGNGYIPTSALKEILHELDPKLTDHELDGIIEEIDEDGSGTVDFDGRNRIYETVAINHIIRWVYFQNLWK